MARTLLAELKDFQLVDSDQDCRGWPVRDAYGAASFKDGVVLLDHAQAIDRVALTPSTLVGQRRR